MDSNCIIHCECSSSFRFMDTFCYICSPHYADSSYCIPSYKSATFNTVETILFFVMAFILVSAMAHVISDYIVHHFQKMLDVIGSIFVIVPFIYVLAVLLYRLLFQSHCVQSVYQKVKPWLLCYCKVSITHADSQESLPDRIAYDHPEENTALLTVPVQWDSDSEANNY